MLLLQYTKEISSKEAESLKKAKTFLNTMEKFPEDVTLLREAIDNYQPVRKKKKLAKASIELGEFLAPEYEMVERYGLSFCSKRAGVSAKKELYFNWGATNIFYGDLFFSVTEREKTLAEFYLGNFLGGQDRDCPDVLKAGAIAKIARYFYNRPAIYGKIYKLLTEQRKEFCCATGKPFYEALISLFSVKKQPRIQLFGAFQGQKLEQIFDYRKAATDFSLGHFCYVFPKSAKGTAASSNIVFELWLTPKNKLIINANFVEDSAARGLSLLKKFASVSKQQEVKTLVTTGIEAWLGNLVLVATFEKNIYKKIQTTLLLKNI